jgi:hypothetical protein
MTIKPIGSELIIQFKLAQCQRVQVLLIPRTSTTTISTNLKYYLKEQENTLDVKECTKGTSKDLH